MRVLDYYAERRLVGRFLDERCERGPGRSVMARELFAAYRAFAEGQGARPVSAAVFGIELRKRGTVAAHSTDGRRYHGVALRDG